MLINNLFYTLHGFIAALTVCAYQAEGNTQKTTYQCAESNEICDLHLPQACCDNKLTCKRKKSRNNFVCQKRATLGASCAYDEDCNEIKHAKCSHSKSCVCIPNHIWVNGSYCGADLGLFCWSDEKCATNHASCTDNECQCDENYSQTSDHQCLPVLIVSSCETDSHCESIKFAKCSVDKHCICSSNTQTVNGTCVPILNNFCLTDYDCHVNNSECIISKCTCKSMFKTISSTECREPSLGMACEKTTDCDELIKHSNCSEDMKCTCIEDYYAINNKTCAMEFKIKCQNDEQCALKNSICINNQCQCKHDYVFRETDCVPTLLGMACKTENDCREIKFSTCLKDSVCVCKSNYIESNISTCSSFIYGNCTENKDCIVQKSYCFQNKCQCIENNFAYSNDLCTPILLNATCQTNKDCEKIRNSFCSIYKKCSCSSGYIAINERKCVPPLEQFCTKNKPCVAENSICINNRCQCKSNFVKYQNAECIPRRLYKYCKENSDCQDPGQECSNEKCVCEYNYITLSSTNKCAPLLNGFCAKKKDCYVKNSICVEKKCQCGFDHLPNSNYECEPYFLGKLCATDMDCTNIKNSKCSAENVCVCHMNFFAFGKFLCRPTLNGLCSDDQDCYSDSFHCSDNRCQCKTNYTALSVDRCVETHLLSSCTDVSECSDSWHSTCSPEGKCVCALNNKAIATSTCLPILNGYCWRDDQCMAENSLCIDFSCQCKQNFIGVASNLCVSIN